MASICTLLWKGLEWDNRDNKTISNLKTTLGVLVDQDLSYGDILAGRPEAWLVTQMFFYMHAITKFQKGPHIEIQNNFQNMFCFYDSFNGLRVKSLYWCSVLAFSVNVLFSCAVEDSVFLH